MNKPFSEKLKDYRKQLQVKRNEKIGQVVLAKELGVSRGNIGDLERGVRIPSKKFLVKLAEHSSKSLNYWMEGIEEYDAPNSLDLVLDKMIDKGLIKDTNLSDEVWKIIEDAVLLEVRRKLK